MTLKEFIKYHKKIKDICKDYNIEEGWTARSYPNFTCEIQHKIFPE